jgi:hypothetical protein
MRLTRNTFAWQVFENQDSFSLEKCYGWPGFDAALTN